MRRLVNTLNFSSFTFNSYLSISQNSFRAFGFSFCRHPEIQGKDNSTVRFLCRHMTCNQHHALDQGQTRWVLTCLAIWAWWCFSRWHDTFLGSFPVLSLCRGKSLPCWHSHSLCLSNRRDGAGGGSEDTGISTGGSENIGVSAGGNWQKLLLQVNEVTFQ